MHTSAEVREIGERVVVAMRVCENLVNDASQGECKPIKHCASSTNHGQRKINMSLTLLSSIHQLQQMPPRILQSAKSCANKNMLC